MVGSFTTFYENDEQVRVGEQMEATKFYGDTFYIGCGTERVVLCSRAVLYVSQYHLAMQTSLFVHTASRLAG